MMTQFQFCCNFIISRIFRDGELRWHGLLPRLGLERLELWNSAGKILISWFLGHSVKCLSFTVLTPKISLKFLAADLPSQTLSSTAGISGEASDQIFFSLTIIIATFNVVITDSFSCQALKILLSTEREPTYIDGWERSFSPNLKENIFPREDWGRFLTCT